MLYGILLGIFEIERMEPLINRMVDAELDIRLFERGFQLAAKVHVRSDIDAVPVPRIVALEQAEAVMVLRDEVYILCAGLFKELRPLVGIKEFRLEAADKVLILRSGGIHPVVELARGAVLVAYLLHIPLGILPFFGIRRHGIETPVDEYAELRIREPIRHMAAVERFPVIFVMHFNSPFCYISEKTSPTPLNIYVGL